ncbi:MAG: gliding motility lipoprotein GldH [Bacteroidota bacterium]
MHRYGLIIIILLFLVACNENLVYSEYVAINSGTWKKQDTITFQCKDLDTLKKHHIFLNVRNDERYEFSNLFVILELEAPNGNTKVDTLEYEMALPSGEWLGKGMGSIKESKLWYKENIDFEDSGVYKISVLHAMRKNGQVQGLEELSGITDVGIQIEKAK